MAEKRHEPRVEVNREFTSFSEFVREYALNLSHSGVFIRTAEALPVGTQVKLRFTVIVDDFETIEGTGEVVRTVDPQDSEEPGVGVVFTSLTSESRDVLARLFTRSGAGHGP